MIRLRSLLCEGRGRIPSISEIDDDVKRKMAAAAQAVYDEWEQDEEGEDMQYGTGGICDCIAQAIADQLPGLGKMQTQYSEPHTYVIAQFKEGIFTIDIPYSIYETGDFYTWKKKSGVKFDPSHIVIYKLDPNNRNWKKYTEYD